jgi:hypothetical protein
MKTGFYCAVVVTVCVWGFPVGASEATDKLAASVPAEVSEVVSGGTWSQGPTSGVYRAIVVATPSADGQQANVVVQMLSLESPTAVPKVVKSVLIKEVADKKLANAFLAMDAETDNEMTLIVTAYGAGADQDTSLHVKFNGSGTYEILPTPGEEAPADAGADKKK